MWLAAFARKVERYKITKSWVTERDLLMNGREETLAVTSSSFSFRSKERSFSLEEKSDRWSWIIPDIRDIRDREKKSVAVCEMGPALAQVQLKREKAPQERSRPPRKAVVHNLWVSSPLSYLCLQTYLHYDSLRQQNRSYEVAVK